MVVSLQSRVLVRRSSIVCDGTQQVQKDSQRPSEGTGAVGPAVWKKRICLRHKNSVHRVCQLTNSAYPKLSDSTINMATFFCERFFFFFRAQNRIQTLWSSRARWRRGREGALVQVPHAPCPSVPEQDA